MYDTDYADHTGMSSLDRVNENAILQNRKICSRVYPRNP